MNREPARALKALGARGKKGMIRDAEYWRSWEEANVLSRPLDFHANLRLMDAMYEEARLLGRFAASDPLAGLEIKINVARVINVCRASGTDRPKA